MTESNQDVPMAPRERPMPHEGPPTARDRKSLYLYLMLAIILVSGFVVAGLILA